MEARSICFCFPHELTTPKPFVFVRTGPRHFSDLLQVVFKSIGFIHRVYPLSIPSSFYLRSALPFETRWFCPPPQKSLSVGFMFRRKEDPSPTPDLKPVCIEFSVCPSPFPRVAELDFPVLLFLLTTQNHFALFSAHPPCSSSERQIVAYLFLARSIQIVIPPSLVPSPLMFLSWSLLRDARMLDENVLPGSLDSRDPFPLLVSFFSPSFNRTKRWMFTWFTKTRVWL